MAFHFTLLQPERVFLLSMENRKIDIQFSIFFELKQEELWPLGYGAELVIMVDCWKMQE